MPKFQRLINTIQSEKYQYTEQPYILNQSNDDLFTGTNNLKQDGKIHDARIFSKFIHTQEDLNKLVEQRVLFVESNSNELGDGDFIDNDKVLIQNSTFGHPNPISNHLIGFFTLGKLMTSHLNIVHGGAIATLIDEFFVKAVLPLTPNNFAVTANLNIKYLKPLKFKPDQNYLEVLLDCFILELENNRKFKVVGRLKSIDGQNQFCYGEVLVIVPRVSLDEM